jgi:AcrR family transcriptional regulator
VTPPNQARRNPPRRANERRRTPVSLGWRRRNNNRADHLARPRRQRHVLPYFSSKEDVLAALADRFATQLLHKIKTAVAKEPAGHWRGKLQTWAKACVTGYLESIRLHDILFYGSRPRTREGFTGNIVLDHLTTLLEAGIVADAPLDDPHFTAVFLFSGLHAVVDDAYSKEKRVNRTRLSHRAEQLCSRAIGLPPD